MRIKLTAEAWKYNRPETVLRLFADLVRMKASVLESETLSMRGTYWTNSSHGFIMHVDIPAFNPAAMMARLEGQTGEEIADRILRDLDSLSALLRTSEVIPALVVVHDEEEEVAIELANRLDFNHIEDPDGRRVHYAREKT